MYGVPGGIRTRDLLIKSQLLFQLSYRHIYKTEVAYGELLYRERLGEGRSNDIAAIYQTDIITILFS